VFARLKAWLAHLDSIGRLQSDRPPAGSGSKSRSMRRALQRRQPRALQHL
jgi:hypothetical protein